MKTLSDYMKINYRMKIVEDAEEGGFVVSFPELSMPYLWRYKRKSNC